MRPKKRVLLIDSDEDRRGELKFVLTVCGYNVIQHARGQIDLILVRWPVANGSVKKLKLTNPLTPLVVIAPVAERMPWSPHADVIWWANMGRAEMLENIRVISARKRGPRKGYTRKSPSTETIQPAAQAATA